MYNVIKPLLAVFIMSISVNAFAASQTEINKQTAINFFNTTLNEKNPEKAVELYGGGHYIQHNPLATDGWDGFKSFLKYFLTQNPDLNAKIVRVIAENDLVVIHSHFTLSKQDTHGMAAMDVFRLEDGKIVEHWDVMQPVPEKSANTNGML